MPPKPIIVTYQHPSGIVTALDEFIERDMTQRGYIWDGSGYDLQTKMRELFFVQP